VRSGFLQALRTGVVAELFIPGIFLLLLHNSKDGLHVLLRRAVGRESSVSRELLIREDELGLGEFRLIVLVVDGLDRDGTEFGILGRLALHCKHPAVVPSLHAHTHATAHTAARGEEGEDARRHHYHAAADDHANEEVPVDNKLLVKGLAGRANALEVILEAMGLEQGRFKERIANVGAETRPIGVAGLIQGGSDRTTTTSGTRAASVRMSNGRMSRYWVWRLLCRILTPIVHHLLAGGLKFVFMALEAFGLEQVLGRGRMELGAEFCQIVTTSPKHRIMHSSMSSVSSVITVSVGFSVGRGNQGE